MDEPSHAPPGYRCPFCRVAAGEDLDGDYTKQADVVYRDAVVTAFVSSAWWPANPGHALVVPNAHHENVYAIPDDLLAHVQVVGKRIARAIRASYGCDGTSFRQHNEPAGNQDVWHYHLHVFPRYAGDDLYLRTRERRNTTLAERAPYAEKLSAALAAEAADALPRSVASYRSPKTRVGPSGVEGRGLFAAQPIARGEVVAIKGGHVVDEATYQRHEETIGNSDVKIADGFHLGALHPDEYEAVMLFLNHSCEPNVGVQGDSVFVAMRDLAPGEELTIDYAMIDDCDDRMDCRCGAPRCRGEVTGRDWRLPELQARYGGYFSAYLLRKIQDGSVG